MALTYWAGNRITGLSTDSKPTNVPDGTLFNETDGSRDRFIFVGGTWHKYEVAGGGGGINYTVDVFTSSGTYNKPSNLDYCYVLMVSGGGGARAGRRGAAGSNRGGGGAGNGGFILSKFNNSDLDSSESVTVGAGGSGASATTTDNTNGSNGTSGGFSEFKYGSLYRIGGGGANFGGAISVIGAQSSNNTFNLTDNRASVLSNFSNASVLGTNAISDVDRGNSGLPAGALSIPRALNNTSMGGQINNSNTQFAAGDLGGFYDDTNTLIGEMTGTAPEAGDGAQPTEFYTFGQFLARLFPWFAPADANYNIGRGGVGGGCGDTAGTIPGGKGGDALGYGAGGGGGGASTNGANSGAGGDGSDGIVIIVNVLTD